MHLQACQEANWDGWILQRCLCAAGVTAVENLAWINALGLSGIGEALMGFPEKMQETWKGQPLCWELKGSLCVPWKYVFHQEIGLTLALEFIFWGSPGNFVTSYPLSKLLKLGNPLKKTCKHWIQRRVLLIFTGVSSLVSCFVGWRTFILSTWSSSNAGWLLSQPSSGIRVWELAACIFSMCLCFPCSNTTAFMGTATKSLILQTTFMGLKFKGSFWQKNLQWHMLWSRACTWFLSLQC